MTLHRIPDPPLTAAEFARVLGKNVGTVRALIESGVLPGYRAGRNFIIPREAFDLFMKGQWQRPAQASDFIHRRRSA